MLKPFKPSIKEIAPLIEETVNNGKDARLTVTGFSMYPLFYSGADDVILTKADRLKKYDVVLYKRANGSYVFHRIIKIKGDILTIAGDNEVQKEYPVKKAQVIAVMTAFVRRGKQYTVSAPWYVIYSKLWLLIFPMRHIAIRLLKKIKGAFSHKKNK